MRSLTIAIIFYNEEKKIQPCLQTLLSESEVFEDQIEFLFINNNSDDGSPKMIEQWCEENKQLKTRIIQRKENHLSKARQQAVEESKTDYLAFIDADCRLQPEWMSAIFKIIGDWPDDVGAYGGASQYSETQDWHPFASSLAKLFPWGKAGGEKIKVPHMPTNNYLLKRSAALEVGGFHPLFSRVGEDLDFNTRLNKKYNIYFNPNFQVIHELPEYYRDWLRKMAFYGRAQSLVLFNNRGGLAPTKFLPLGFTLFYSYALLSFPVQAQIVFLISMIIPRLRFLTLSFLFYGFGELVGAFIFLCNFKLAGAKALRRKSLQTQS